MVFHTKMVDNLDEIMLETYILSVAAHYNSWYSDVLMCNVSGGFGRVNQRAFVSITPECCIPFNPEEFSDYNEFCAPAELIEPYSVKLLNESLMWHIANQVQ